MQLLDFLGLGDAFKLFWLVLIYIVVLAFGIYVVMSPETVLKILEPFLQLFGFRSRNKEETNIVDVSLEPFDGYSERKQEEEQKRQEEVRIQALQDEFTKSWNDECNKLLAERDLGKLFELVQKNKEISEWAMQEYFQNKLENPAFVHYKVGSESLMDNTDIDRAFDIIGQWIKVPVYEEEARHLTNKAEFLTASNKKKSILRDVVLEEFIASLHTPKSQLVIELFMKQLIQNWEEAKTLYKYENYKEAYKLFVLADKPKEWADLLRKSLFYLATNESGNSEIHDTIFTIASRYLNSTFHDDRGNIFIEKNVDFLIAECLDRARNNVSELVEMKEDIGRTVQSLIEQVHLSPEIQILMNAFDYMKAYKQEKLVLELMVSKDIDLEPRLLERLEELKSGKTEVIVHNDKTLNVFAYDPRISEWDNNKIFEFFEGDQQNHSETDTNVVVSEWSKGLQADIVDWENEDFYHTFIEVLKEDFEDEVHCEIVMARPIAGEPTQEYMGLLVIPDFEDEPFGFQGIALLISGEKKSRHNLVIKVDTVFVPASVPEYYGNRMDEIYNKVLNLKEERNHKLIRFVNHVRELFISEARHWLDSIFRH